MKKWMLGVATLSLITACGGGTTKKAQPSNNGGVNNSNNGANNTNGGGNNSNNGGNNSNNGGNNSNNFTAYPNNSNNRDYSTCYIDNDGDGYGDAEEIIDSLCDEAGLANEGGDCDDSRADVFPGADEVECDGVDRNCDGTWNGAVPAICGTIQEALDAVASTGAEAVIDVDPGTYNENIAFNGARAHLRGAGPDVTTISGTADTTVVRFNSGEDERSILEGFEITGGQGFAEGDSRVGGGIYVDNADPVLRNLVVSGNEAVGSSGYGGGISLARSESLVERVDVIGNGSGYYGGGVHISQGGPTLRQLRVVSNGATYGGGIAVYFSDATIEASSFALNSASFGGGVFVQGEAPALSNLTLIRNEADEGGAIACSSCDSAIVSSTFHQNSATLGGAIFNEDGQPSVSYVNFFDNGADKELSGLSVAGAAGVLRSDSGFVSLAGGPLNWDLHLGAGSPLIDTGDPGVADADGSASDIGAHGGPYGDW